ncbi:TetR/AcrR family transcriptional regulator [Parvibaculum sp.]|uniref:TetR/AcrR family transcriptional regulator n=1 Tax=Parvibaculum sp. TaxID=2024848 RepID=UPI000C8D381E|nr:TetR/AcrR family transcriptional regulator [Parvibaculum sp.]MAB12835.1 TetR family transcriptional regulator [Parvibaculum sp.]
MSHDPPHIPLPEFPPYLKRERPASRAERTRQALLEAAFLEIYLKGFRAASLSDILEVSGCTKGALYHHFTDKHALGLAALGDAFHRFLDHNWYQPLAGTDDPVTELRRIIERHVNGELGVDPRLGCPINNLSQEMSPIDEEFRLFLSGVLAEWRGHIADALERGKAAGTVRADVDAEGVAAYIVATHQGVSGMLKTTRDISLAEKCAHSYFDYLEHLRA